MPYSRVDLKSLGAGSEADQGAAGSGRIRWMVVPLSAALCIAQAILTITAQHQVNVFLTSTLISVVAFGVLFALVLLVNPALRLLGRGGNDRGLSRGEIVSVFAAMLVTSGICTFGLVAQLVPLVATPWNPEWNTPLRGWSEGVLPRMNPSLYLTDEKQILVFREGIRTTPGGQHIAEPAPSSGWREYVVHSWIVMRSIPWRIWVRPLGSWLVFVFASYGMFYCLTYVVFPYWNGRQKIAFPLARLPLALVPQGDGARIPAILRSPWFWLGFGLSFGIVHFNALVASGFIETMNRIPLGLSHSRVTEVLGGTFLEGLGGGGRQTLMFLVIFTAVGIAFLLPTHISFSVWFYFLLAQGIILILVHSGHGRNTRDFPSEMLLVNNPITAQGAGALLCMSAVSLGACLRDRARSVRLRSGPARAGPLVPVLGLVACLGAMAAWLSWNRVGIGLALLVVVFVALVSVGFMRIVAESGIYWFQSHGSFFHFLRATGLGRLVGIQGLGPLLPIYSVLFFDIKTFLAPNLLNAVKMKHDVGARGRPFHANLLVCILITTFASLAFEIFLGYLWGAQQMQRWFYTSGPIYIMTSAQRLIDDPVRLDLSAAGWTGLGAVWVAVTMAARRTLFWVPHPIGYVLLISPLVAQMWFSFFLGWGCKKLVVKYGAKATYDTLGPAFIGLVAGELICILLWSLLSIPLGAATGIDLNRYGP